MLEIEVFLIATVQIFQLNNRREGRRQVKEEDEERGGGANRQTENGGFPFGVVYAEHFFFECDKETA